MRKISLLLMTLCFQYSLPAQTDYKIINLTDKYKQSVFGMTRYGNNWLVTAADCTKKGKSHTDIYLTDERLTGLQPFAKEVMTALDDGTPSFHGQTLYYTGVYKDFSGPDETTAKKLRIETAVTSGATWTKTDEFPYNSPTYRTAHPAINNTGNLMVFSSDMPGGKGGMDLYYCIKDGNKWMEPQNITNLNTAGNELFPAFTGSGTLVYSSDGLEGSGGLDLFAAKETVEGFDTPHNLGRPLNSEYDDFCMFSENEMNTGYLSSNRFGDHSKDDVLLFKKVSTGTTLVIKVMDKYTATPLPYVFVTIKNKSGEIFHKGLTDPQGLIVLDGIPKDEYTAQGMLNDISTTIGKTGPAESAHDTTVLELLHNDPRFTLSGIALDSRSGQPIDGVMVSCRNKSNNVQKEMSTGADGSFLFQLEQNSDFEVQGSKTGWLSSELAENTTKGLDRTTQLYVDLQLQVQRPVSNGTIKLKKIYYDYNKCDIRPDAEAELNRLTKLLNEYPGMTIELSSHTDARGSDQYNLELSQCRAEAAVRYLIHRGVDAKRLVPRGYGETKLLNHCTGNANCTEAEHMQNRRTEFTVLSCGTCIE